MGFNDLSKDERINLVKNISEEIRNNIETKAPSGLLKYFTDEDTYIRKAAHLAVGRLCKEDENLRTKIIVLLNTLIENKNELIRQSTIDSSGEIGILFFDEIKHLLVKGISDPHNEVRNSAIGALKKMSEKNPVPTLEFAKSYINHPDDEIRREICHGIELRGQTHPEDVMPLLKELQHDKSKDVLKILIHVIGQISYNKDCLPKVIDFLKTWDNTKIVKEALVEILEVHRNYEKFSELTYDEAKAYITKNFSK